MRCSTTSCNQCSHSNKIAGLFVLTNITYCFTTYCTDGFRSDNSIAERLSKCLGKSVVLSTSSGIVGYNYSTEKYTYKFMEKQWISPKSCVKYGSVVIDETKGLKDFISITKSMTYKINTNIIIQLTTEVTSILKYQDIYIIFINYDQLIEFKEHKELSEIFESMYASDEYKNFGVKVKYNNILYNVYKSRSGSMEKSEVEVYKIAMIISKKRFDFEVRRYYPSSSIVASPRIHVSVGCGGIKIYYSDNDNICSCEEAVYETLKLQDFKSIVKFSSEVEIESIIQCHYMPVGKIATENNKQLCLGMGTLTEYLRFEKPRNTLKNIYVHKEGILNVINVYGRALLLNDIKGFTIYNTIMYMVETHNGRPIVYNLSTGYQAEDETGKMVITKLKLAGYEV